MDMTLDHATAKAPGLRRLATQVPGLDTVLGGGVLVGDTYLIAGKPGTGKTTLGNHIAFAHAAAGASVLFATLLTESHDRMLAHLESFHFFDRALVGERIHYVSLLGVLQEEGVEGVMHMLLTTVRSHHASLLIIDGAGVAQMLTGSDFDYARFIHGLQARTAMLGCTTLLLAVERQADPVATHVDGVILLSNEPVHARDARWLRVVKHRGSAYINGRHRFAIDDAGFTVFPRLEAVHADIEPTWHESDERLLFGVRGLDAMTVGGLPVGSVTLVLGTPGAGKTLLGLHFLAEGARRGEAGLITTFDETAPALAATADGAGMELGQHLDAGLVQVMWQPPLELAPDAWAWQLLAAVDAHRPRRLVIDAFGDLMPLFAIPERRSLFLPALANGLRDRGVTALINFEIDTFIDQKLVTPVENVSASVDNVIFLRTVELASLLRRIMSVLKERQTGFDPAIREFTIGPDGIVVGDPFDASGLMTGSAAPLRDHE
jgi:circadian clock protein KaiC